MLKLKVCQDCGREFPQFQIINDKKIDFHGRNRCFACFPYKDRKVKLSQTCPKCHKIFRINTIENDKLKSLSGRKFCLDCHPFRERVDKYHDKIKQFYPTHGTDWCVTNLGLTKNQVTYIAQKLNLSLSGETYHNICKNAHHIPPENHKVNHTNFLNIDCPSKAYLLGLIWTDGHISKNRNTITFSTTPPDSEYFQKIFLTTGSWQISRCKSKNPNEKEKVSFYTTNRFLHKFLKDHSFSNKSVGFQKIYDFIPDKFKCSFLIGVIDGDGYFSNGEKSAYHFHICSNYAQNWDCIEQILKNLQIEYKIERTHSKSGSYSKIHIYGKLRVEKWGDYVYKDFNTHSLGLPRKHDRYLSIKSMCGKCRHEKTISSPT